VKPNGAIALFGSEPFSSALRMSNIEKFLYDWIWKKNRQTGFMNAKYIPLKEHEIISVFSEAPARANQFSDYCVCYYPQGLIVSEKLLAGKKKGSAANNTRGNTEKNYIQTHRNYPTSVIIISCDFNGVHPTQKPVALMKYLIQTYTNAGETVLDFTMGSGSTGVGCAETGRRFVGIELDHDYYKIAKKRIEDAYAQPTLFEPVVIESKAEQKELL
jgi:site-specific DNA-methyltransferase (adenine-specific)